MTPEMQKAKERHSGLTKYFLRLNTDITWKNTKQKHLIGRVHNRAQR